MILNNLYNFKNPVKNFLNIDGFKFPKDISSIEISKLCWTEPFNFRVKKQDDKYRTLKMPNILNFVCAYEHFKDIPYFREIQKLDPLHKRLSANIDTGDFVSGEYDKQFEADLEKLCIFDNLIKIDIKEYYGRIYTHKIDFQGHEERFLSNMNVGASNGLIMGNYLSLYFAELILKSVSDSIEAEIANAGIDCEFSYFSDDFYFFCNKNDNEKIVKIFDKALEGYGLERNETKKEIWTYETLNDYNILTRYWKKVMVFCLGKLNLSRTDNKLYFINQIIYRMSNLQDDKLKKIFINNFFKTKFFRELDLHKYIIKSYDYHQLCFILKFSPESMLYAVDKLISMKDFDISRLHKFLKIRYREVLRESFNEEQLYFYYAIKILGYTDILIVEKDSVLQTDNQILISYYLKDKLFSTEDIELLKTNVDEKFWFQNYHLILYTPDLSTDINEGIEKYLIPQNANKAASKETYMNFYKVNLLANNSIIRDITNVHVEIDNYLRLRIVESEANYRKR